MRGGGRRRRLRSLQSVAILLLAVVTVIVIASCRSIVGIDDRQSAPACGPTFSDSLCAECSERSCCAELGACALDSDCAASSSCLARCATPADDACRSHCADQHRAGFGRLLANVLACQSRQCSSECKMPCGGLVTSSSECGSCYALACCAGARTCSESSSCLSRRFCRETCTEDSCRRLCDKRDVDGENADGILNRCQSASCASACTAWSCAASSGANTNTNVSLSSQDSSAPVQNAKHQIEVTIFVRDSVATTTPVTNLTIRRCARSKSPCEKVGDDLVTNGSGVARLTAFGVSTTQEGFEDYFEVTDPNGNYLPEIVFVAPPLRRDALVLVQAFTKLAREQFVQGLQLGNVPATRGDLLFHAVDCQWNEAAGVRLELPTPSTEATEFYLSRSIPIRMGAGVTSTDDHTAFGGFIGMEPANYTVAGRAMIGGAPANAFSVSVYVRSGTITFVDFAAAR